MRPARVTNHEFVQSNECERTHGAKQRLRALWAAGTIPERREIVRILTEQVTLRRKKEAKKWERGAVEIVAKWKKSA